MIRWFYKNLLWTQGRYIAFVLGALLLISYFIFPIALIALIPLTVFVLYFFRFPDRPLPVALSEYDIVSPTDGTVLDVVEEDSKYRIMIFLSVCNVHVNWIPSSGVIKSITYRPGKFLVAYHPKSSDYNERNDVVIKTNENRLIEVRQIAGIIARRICWWIKPSDTVKRGDAFGMIRFGSRIEIIVNKDEVEVYLKKKQKVIGAQTIIGRWKVNNDKKNISNNAPE